MLSTCPNLVGGVSSCGQLANSDHDMVMSELLLPVKASESVETVPDYGKADFNKIREFLVEIDWFEVLEGLNTEESWDSFKHILQETVDKCVPTKIRRSSTKPLWMKPNIIRKIRKKRRVWRWYQSTKEYIAWQAYKKIQQEVSKAVKNAKKSFERKLAKNSKKNPRAFWAHINKSTKSRPTVGPLKNKNGEMQTEDKPMADLLNNFFSSVFTKEDMTNFPNAEQIFTGEDPLASVHICPEKVKEKLAKIRPNSAPGPDKIFPRIVHNLKEELSIPLTIIFNRSMKEGVVPKDWQIANVMPTYKGKGSKTDPGCYRPVSLTSIICRTMEGLLKDAIVDHLVKHKLIRTSQHGFVPGRSCVTNLLEYLDKMTELYDQGHSVDIFYLDFAKAFDKVPHARLLAKLRGHGITGEVATWIEAWLSGRQQRVVLNGSSSDWEDVTSGVPQGSCLGPILFVIFIDDIDTAVNMDGLFMSKFADDTKTARVVDTDVEASVLQEDLNGLSAWAKTWQMAFNVDKCKVIHVGRNNAGRDYFMDGKKLIVVEEE